MAAVGRRLSAAWSSLLSFNCVQMVLYKGNSKKVLPSVSSDFTLTNPSGINTRRRQPLQFKLCKTAQEHPEILFLNANFDVNEPMCKNINTKVLPYFHFYRGVDGQLVSFSCSRARRIMIPIEVE